MEAVVCIVDCVHITCSLSTKPHCEKISIIIKTPQVRFNLENVLHVKDNNYNSLLDGMFPILVVSYEAVDVVNAPIVLISTYKVLLESKKKGSLGSNSLTRHFLAKCKLDLKSEILLFFVP